MSGDRVEGNMRIAVLGFFAVVLLTNRVYPTRERGGMYRVRRDFHNALTKALLEDMGVELPADPENDEVSE